MLINCCVNVLSRSSLNILDRYLYGKLSLNFFFIYFSSVFLPLIYGICGVLLYDKINVSIKYFFSFNCFFLALSTHIVGLSFSLAFKYKDIRHIVLHSKIPELLFPIFIIISIFLNMPISYKITLRCFLPLVITWLSFIPYFLNGKYTNVLFDKYALFTAIPAEIHQYL